MKYGITFEEANKFSNPSLTPLVHWIHWFMEKFCKDKSKETYNILVDIYVYNKHCDSYIKALSSTEDLDNTVDIMLPIMHKHYPQLMKSKLKFRKVKCK